MERKPGAGAIAELRSMMKPVTEAQYQMNSAIDKLVLSQMRLESKAAGKITEMTNALRKKDRNQGTESEKIQLVMANLIEVNNWRNNCTTHRVQVGVVTLLRSDVPSQKGEMR